MSNATDLQNRLIEAVQKEFPKSRLWRNNTGQAYPLTSFKRAWEFLKNGVHPPWLRPVTYGVVGAGDVAGWLHVDGRAIVLHIEVKIGKDEQRGSQKVFEKVVVACGGIYIIARSVDQCIADLRAVLK